MKNQDVSTLFKPFASFFGRFHVTLFIIVLTAGLVVAVLTFKTLVLDASTPGTSLSGSSPTSFDQTTINRINQLHTSDESTSDYTPPEGRINPFTE